MAQMPVMPLETDHGLKAFMFQTFNTISVGGTINISLVIGENKTCAQAPTTQLLTIE